MIHSISIDLTSYHFKSYNIILYSNSFLKFIGYLDGLNTLHPNWYLNLDTHSINITYPSISFYVEGTILSYHASDKTHITPIDLIKYWNKSSAILNLHSPNKFISIISNMIIIGFNQSKILACFNNGKIASLSTLIPSLKN